VGVSDRGCVLDNITFVLKIEIMNVLGHDREGKVTLIHGGPIIASRGYKESKQNDKHGR